jgi:hypothetical protein
MEMVSFCNYSFVGLAVALLGVQVPIREYLWAFGDVRVLMCETNGWYSYTSRFMDVVVITYIKQSFILVFYPTYQVGHSTLLEH